MELLQIDWGLVFGVLTLLLIVQLYQIKSRYQKLEKIHEQLKKSILENANEQLAAIQNHKNMITQQVTEAALDSIVDTYFEKQIPALEKLIKTIDEINITTEQAIAILKQMKVTNE